MRQPIPPTWIVVMDSSRACFWRLHHDDNNRLAIDEAMAPMTSNLHAHSRDVVTDKPGRYNRGAGQLQVDTFNTEHDPHKLEKHDFVHDVVDALRHAHDTNRFARLAVVAPERTIGEFRSLAPDTLKKTLWREIGKDFVKLRRDELWARIGAEMTDHPGG